MILASFSRGLCLAVGFPMLTGMKVCQARRRVQEGLPCHRFNTCVNMVMLESPPRAEGPGRETRPRIRSCIISGRRAAALFELCSVLRKQGTGC